MKKIAAVGAIAAFLLAVSGSLSLSATTREAVIHKCNAQTLKWVPKGGVNYEHRRAVVWKGCMTSHGQRP
jgi:hypothetical protein